MAHLTLFNLSPHHFSFALILPYPLFLYPTPISHLSSCLAISSLYPFISFFLPHSSRFKQRYLAPPYSSWSLPSVPVTWRFRSLPTCMATLSPSLAVIVQCSDGTRRSSRRLRVSLPTQRCLTRWRRWVWGYSGFMDINRLIDKWTGDYIVIGMKIRTRLMDEVKLRCSLSSRG